MARTVVLLTLVMIPFQNCGPSFRTLPLGMNDSSSSALIDSGKMLFSMKCMSCHGDITTTNKKDATAARITWALSNIPQMSFLKGSLSPNDILALEAALSSRPNDLTCNPNVIGRVGIHQLNSHEYNNVIRDLTGIDSKPASALPKDPYTGFFSNIAASLTVDMARAQIYFDLGIKILDQVFSQNYGQIVTCNPATSGARPCADKVITEFGLKAFRRPMLADEKITYLTLFDNLYASFPAGTSGNKFDESLKGALHAMLIAPQFIYRIIEVPSTEPGYVKTLTPYELASRLSFFIWGSIPDATLFSLAANGTILENGVLLAQVDRMLKDPKSSHIANTFGSQWLELEALNSANPDPSVYPEFNESLRQSMMTESKLLLNDIIQKDGTPYLLLNADYTYLNRQLASFYQVGGVGTDQFIKVSIANTPRVGIITHGSLLTANARTNESSIVHRGLWAINRILCSPVGAPPQDVDTTLPPQTASTNPRKSLEAHISAPECAGCHRQIDPVGYGLENFDGIGKYRTHYRNGDIVNSSGEFADGGSFTTAREMSRLLIQNPKFKTCYSRNLVTFSLGRLLNENDKCFADSIGRVTVSPTGKFSDLVKSIVTSEQFLKQKGAN